MISKKQAAFVREYLKDFNGTQAAIRAGYSQKTADAQASRLLKNVKIQAEVQRRQGKIEERAAVTVDQIVAELVKVAFGDAGALFDDMGALKPVKDLDDAARASIAGIEVVSVAGSPATLTKIKRWDKLKAAELLGRYLGMFKDKLELSGNVDFASAIEAARNRARR